MGIFSKQTLRRVLYFFPFQLFFLHLKRNHLLLIFWVILFGVVTEVFAKKYGVPYLFLDPEYLDKIDFWSHFIIGAACGGFIMAFNIASYVMNGFRFHFLATLNRPFLKYCLNNFIIPLVFVLTYVYCLFDFQLNRDIFELRQVLIHVGGFLSGLAVMLIFGFTYFFSTNKNIFKMFGIEVDDETEPDEIRQKKINPIDKTLNPSLKYRSWISRDMNAWHIETYMSSPLKIRLARSTEHYETEMLMLVFEQNHLNAAVFEIGVFVILLVLGLFREVPAFEIPAGASLMLLFTMFLMLTSALHSWLRGWSTTIFIGVFLLVNYLSQYDFFNYENKVYGLNYNTTKAVYSNENLTPNPENNGFYVQDVNSTIEILNKWRLKNSKNTIKRSQKPKLVIVSASGGGLRSALWTFHSLSYVDSLLEGELLQHTQLITGSSGGMIGAAYLRELYLRKQTGEIDNYYNDTLIASIGRDMLNPVGFSITVNDLFLRLQSFEYGGYEYIKDRAHAFEHQLNKNTNFVLNKHLAEYVLPVAEARIPMMVFAPTIKNDGRRLLISSQPISYLTTTIPNNNVTNSVIFDGVEYTRFLKEQNALNTRFTSILRVNATFPYITPIPTLPTEPPVEIMDAGVRDNFGIKTTVKYIHTFKEWISTNTSGVIIIQVRDKHKTFPVESTPLQTISDAMLSPVGSIYDNLFYVQDYDHDQLIQYMSSWFDGPIDVIDFQMRNEGKDRISLSWHLTQREKEYILNAINLPENKEAIEKLTRLLE